MNKAFLAGLMFMLLLGSFGFTQLITTAGDSYNNAVVSVCLNETTILNSLNVYRCIDNDCHMITANATHDCQFGCSSESVPNYCKASPAQTNIMLAVVFIIVIIITIILLMKAMKRR